MPLVRFTVCNSSGPEMTRYITCDLIRDFLPRKGEVFVANIYPLEIKEVFHRDIPDQPNYDVVMVATSQIIDHIRDDPHHIWSYGPASSKD